MTVTIVLALLLGAGLGAGAVVVGWALTFREKDRLERFIQGMHRAWKGPRCMSCEGPLLPSRLATEGISAEYLVGLIRRETQLKACGPNEAWDQLDDIRSAYLCEINRGNGFEKAVAVNVASGTMYYLNPLRLEQTASRGRILMFHCGAMFYARSKVAPKTELDVIIREKEPN